MAALHQGLDRWFDDSISAPRRWNGETNLKTWNPAVDVYEESDRFVIKAELPGLDRKDIEVDLNDRVLTLKGERSFENEVKEDGYYRKERAFGKFHRAFTLPANLNADEIKAEFKDGLLTINIPKPEEEKPKQITIH
jgi:HSP20 family protein